ncbi:MAG: PorV/PorQ family protein [Bacteroidota bacterium]
MKRILISILGILSIGANAQILKYSNEFLAIGVGARAAGMGGAVVASTDDATAAYWNPAGLMQIKDNVQVTLMHNEQFAGIVKHDYGTVAYKFNDKSALAISMIRVGVDDIPNTLNLFQNGQLDYSRIKSFSSVDYGFIGSYARSLPINGLTIGGNVKVIRRVVGEFANAWGFGFDVGAQYRYKKWLAGVSVRDITTTFNVWSYTFSEQEKQVLLQTNNALPSNTLELTAPKMILGLSRKFMLFKEKFSVMPEMNAELTFDGKKNNVLQSTYFNVDPKLGVELGYRNIVFIRGGVMNFQTVKQIDGQKELSYMPSVGVGLKINNLSIDYALSNFGSSADLPYSNIISLRFGINKRG